MNLRVAPDLKAIGRVSIRFPLMNSDELPASASAVSATCIHALLVYAELDLKLLQQAATEPCCAMASTLNRGKD